MFNVSCINTVFIIFTFCFHLVLFFFLQLLHIIKSVLLASAVMRETRVRSLGREDPLKKEMAIHSSILAWRIPWMEKPSRLQSAGLQRVGHDWATSPHLHLSTAGIVLVGYACLCLHWQIFKSCPWSVLWPECVPSHPKIVCWSSNPQSDDMRR